MAVLQTVEEFWEHGGLFVRDAILDMSGPAPRYSLFSRMINVVSLQHAPERPTVFPLE